MAASAHSSRYAAVGPADESGLYAMTRSMMGSATSTEIETRTARRGALCAVVAVARRQILPQADLALGAKSVASRQSPDSKAGGSSADRGSRAAPPAVQYASASGSPVRTQLRHRHRRPDRTERQPVRRVADGRRDLRDPPPLRPTDLRRGTDAAARIASTRDEAEVEGAVDAGTLVNALMCPSNVGPPRARRGSARTRAPGQASQGEHADWGAARNWPRGRSQRRSDAKRSERPVGVCVRPKRHGRGSRHRPPQ
jgi:hypothetical protein